MSDDVNALSFLSSEKNGDITPKIDLNKFISAPLAKGAVVGTATYSLLNTDYTVNLIASHDVQKSELIIMILRILLVLVVLIFLTILISKIIKKKKYKGKFF